MQRWDLIKLKTFYTAKETINKMKRQPTEWEKIFVNDMNNKKLISTVQKQSIQLKIKKTSNPLRNGQETEQTFFQRGNADGQEAREKMLNFANHGGKANQNNSKISRHTCQNDYHQKYLHITVTPKQGGPMEG